MVHFSKEIHNTHGVETLNLDASMCLSVTKQVESHFFTDSELRYSRPNLSIPQPVWTINTNRTELDSRCTVPDNNRLQ